MIPFVEQPSVTLGPLTIHAFGVIVASAAFLGDVLYRRRLLSQGLDASVGARLGWWALTSGFVGAHLFSLVFYFPHKLAAHPWLIFKLWEDVSSFGGMLGGAIGAALFVRLRLNGLTLRDKWKYLDAAAFVLPFAWAVGRVACSLAHDHPGAVTSFPLAISLDGARARAYIAGVYAEAGRTLPQGAALNGLGFHDLGWYECVYLTVVAIPFFIVLDRSGRTRRPGFWLAAFTLCYAPMRIIFDELRLADARYFGVTPGQYAACALLVAGLLAYRVGGSLAEKVTSEVGG